MASSFAISIETPGDIVIVLLPLLMAVINVPAEIPAIAFNSVPTQRFATEGKVIEEVGAFAFKLAVVEIVQVDTLGEVAYGLVKEAEGSNPATTELVAVVIDNAAEAD